MRTAVLSLFFAALAMPAYAGHGTIEETDDAIIVEYTGDASDNAADKRGNAPANAYTSPTDQRLAAKKQQELDEAREARVEARNSGRGTRATRAARQSGSGESEN